MKFHPDRNPDDPDAEHRFKECKEAYEVLCDAHKRAVYDQFGHAGPGRQPRRRIQRRRGVRRYFRRDVRRYFLGRVNAGRSQVFRGADLRYELELDLEKAVFGTETGNSHSVHGRVQDLQGHGRGQGVDAEDLRHLQRPGSGSGAAIHIQPSSNPVRAAKGRARSFPIPCDTCFGQGRVRQEKTLPVKVPAGVDTGDRIRLNGEGEAGRNGGPAGDLYIEIHVKEHAIFEREGSHLSCEVPITFVTAALGGTVEVPTLDGEVILKIPAETQSGRVFRMREKGVRPVRGGAAGDLFCRVVVETPVSLRVEQKELLRKFESSLEQGSHHPKEQTFFEGVKKFFTRTVE